MTVDPKIVLSIIVASFGLAIFIAGVGSTVFKKKGFFKVISIIGGLIFVAWGVPSLVFNAGLYTPSPEVGQWFLSASTQTRYISTGTTGTTVTNGGTTARTSSGTITTYQPTGEYSGLDKFDSTISLAGTSYYKKGTDRATTTAATNLDEGTSVTYWISNSTYWIEPVIKTAGGGVTPFQLLGYTNSSATPTVTVYDNVGRQTVGGGAANFTLASNGNANVEITYQGIAKKSAGPFGGMFVIEHPTDVTSITCSGDFLYSASETKPTFHLTYVPTNGSSAYQTQPYKPGMDDGSASLKKVTCQFQKGSFSTAGTMLVKFIPANYYVSQNGEILLDTEKYADNSNTRTAIASVTNQIDFTN